MLIGAEFTPHIFGTRRRFGLSDQSMAMETIFGWDLLGKAAYKSASIVTFVLSVCYAALEPGLEVQLQKF